MVKTAKDLEVLLSLFEMASSCIPLIFAGCILASSLEVGEILEIIKS